MGIDFERIERLVSLVEENQLVELTVEEDGFSVTVKAEVPTEPPGGADVRAAVEGHHQPAPSQPQAVLMSEHVVEVRAPMIGIFYRGATPDSPPYVEVGEHIEVGQTIGLIEAMKVFSEIPTEVGGRVVAIRAENGKLVQAGDVLMLVDTLEPPQA